MPELGEVAHAVALLRKYLLGKVVTHVSAAHDDSLFVKPLTNEIFKSALESHKITGVARNGKYFMVEIEKARTLVLHFGMTGWIRVKDVGSLIMMEGGGDQKQKAKIEELAANGEDPKKALWATSEWPPKYTKFMSTTDEKDEIAFSDPRRSGRVRLFDVTLDKVGEFEPLSKSGTDFSQSKVPIDEMIPQISKRHVPVKSLSLDQSVFSGIGNWMGDEVSYLAHIHPEQYADTSGRKKAAELMEKVYEVCRIAAETEGNTAEFPKNWLMLHRWGKPRSKKEVQTTADGHKVDYVKVGGRTSCFVPDFQKKFKPQDDKSDEGLLDDSPIKNEDFSDSIKEEEKEEEEEEELKARDEKQSKSKKRKLAKR